MRLPRIVCDATVAVDALLRPEGPSGRLLRRFVERRDFEVVVTEPLLEELRRAATDSRVLARLELGADEVERWLVAFGVLATSVEPGTADPAADPALVAARAAREAVLVTLDPELLALPLTAGLEPVRPEALLEVLEARSAAGLGALADG
ncbi:MAG TPA: PIN domain-containing protein [Thermoanaerobaculia bacterium]|nr:PIN domain-containing protein [Thermoanaerobaculia bacterium]